MIWIASVSSSSGDAVSVPVSNGRPGVRRPLVQNRRADRVGGVRLNGRPGRRRLLRFEAFHRAVLVMLGGVWKHQLRCELRERGELRRHVSDVGESAEHDGCVRARREHRAQGHREHRPWLAAALQRDGDQLVRGLRRSVPVRRSVLPVGGRVEVEVGRR